MRYEFFITQLKVLKYHLLNHLLGLQSSIDNKVHLIK